MVFKRGWGEGKRLAFLLLPGWVAGFVEFTNLALLLDRCGRPSNDQVNLKLDTYNNFGHPENY